MAWFFLFFVLSGFASLVYQVTWLRVAMADFVVTTPMVSIVLSVFMAGLALGSFGAGRIARRLQGQPPRPFLRLYAGTELVIGISGVVVAPLLRLGHQLLILGGEEAWGSVNHYLVSGLCVTLALLPFCTAMGATFPFAMAGIRAIEDEKSRRSFSFLYVANVLGAMAGALTSAFVLIELLGFHNTMLVATLANLVAAATAFLLGQGHKAKRAAPPLPEAVTKSTPMGREEYGLVALLFLTGLVSLAMEVVWTRQFVPFLGPLVYTFAAILAIYLAATTAGSWFYRVWIRRRGAGVLLDVGVLAVAAGVCALLPLVTADPRLSSDPGLLKGVLRLAIGTGPFCAVLGFLLPMVMDRLSAGEPRRAGAAYAVNTLGCIVGPLLSGFVTLPFVGERWSLLLLALPLWVFGLIPNLSGERTRDRRPWPWSRMMVLGSGVVAVLPLILLTRDFETTFAKARVLRDHTATVVATGETRAQKRLIVNGTGMTSLTPITKTMAHLPLAHLEVPPQNGLVLCLGMGTSFRSLVSWGIPSTVVELVPSVPSLLGFYHADGERIRTSPLAHIIVDDARRFLERSHDAFDVIVIDPPPPVQAAASSLLYSAEFYQTAARRLKPTGILQQWIPGGEPVVLSAVTRALTDSFAHVRVFRSMEGWGLHFLASAQPIPVRSAAELAARLPPAAVSDLIEWGPRPTPEEQFQLVLRRELSSRALQAMVPDAPALSDDRPVNEYFLLRRWARQYGKAGDLASVAEEYRQALVLNLDSAEIHYDLGRALGQQGLYEEALVHYSEALRLKPDFVEVHVGLATLLARQGKIPEGIAHLSQALSIEPHHAEAHGILAGLFFQQKRFNEAIIHYEKALEIKPGWPEVHNNLGVALAHMGRFREAASHLSEALQLKPDYVEARNNLNLVLKETTDSPRRQAPVRNQ